MKNKIFKTIAAIGLCLSFAIPTMANTNITTIPASYEQQIDNSVSANYSTETIDLGDFYYDDGDYVSNKLYQSTLDIKNDNAALMERYNLMSNEYKYKILSTGGYRMYFSQEDLGKLNQQYSVIRSFLNSNMQNIVPNGTDRNTALMLINTWICNNCTYEVNQPVSSMASTAFTTGRISCEGYSRAFNAMVEYLPFENGVVNYNATNPTYLDAEMIGDNFHAWSVVVLDGTPYYFDVTFNDGSGNLNQDFMKNYYDFYSEINKTTTIDRYQRSSINDPYRK